MGPPFDSSSRSARLMVRDSGAVGGRGLARIPSIHSLQVIGGRDVGSKMFHSSESFLSLRCYGLLRVYVIRKNC